MTESRHTLALALLIGGMLAACASTPKIQASDVVRQAGAVLQQAAEQHVGDYAAPELKLAHAKYAAARKALRESKPKLATALAQESIASTHLASIQAAGARVTANKLSIQRQIDNMEQLTHTSGDDPGDDQ